MSNLRIEAFISPKISTADRSRRERAIKTKKPRQRLGFFRYISFLYTVMVPVVGLEIGHRHRPACAPRRTVRPDTISRPLKSRHRRDFPLRVAASSPSFTITKKNTPIRGYFSWCRWWDSRRHWGSAAASPGNSKTVHWTVFAPHGDVPFEPPPRCSRQKDKPVLSHGLIFLVQQGNPNPNRFCC